MCSILLKERQVYKKSYILSLLLKCKKAAEECFVTCRNRNPPPVVCHAHMISSSMMDVRKGGKLSRS